MRLLRTEFFKSNGMITEHDARRIALEKKKLASAKVVLKAKEDAMTGRHRSSLRALSWDTKKTYTKDMVRPRHLARASSIAAGAAAELSSASWCPRRPPSDAADGGGVPARLPLQTPILGTPTSLP
jgi:hypothetical protein